MSEWEDRAAAEEVLADVAANGAGYVPTLVDEQTEVMCRAGIRAMVERRGLDATVEFIVQIALPFEDDMRRTEPNNPALALIDQ
jgi:hypothetical protein